MRCLEPKSEESLIQEDMEDFQGIYFVAMSLSLIKYPFSLHQRQRTCLAELCWVAGHFWLIVVNLKLRSMKRNAGHGRGMLATAEECWPPARCWGLKHLKVTTERE